MLGTALPNVDEEAGLSVLEVQFATLQRYFPQEIESIMSARTNIARLCDDLGRDKLALRLKREQYAGELALHGPSHEATLIAGNNLC